MKWPYESYEIIIICTHSIDIGAEAHRGISNVMKFIQLMWTGLNHKPVSLTGIMQI